MQVINKVISHALRFDWDKFSDMSNPLPHTMPDVDQFMEAAQELGINSTSLLVIYDEGVTACIDALAMTLTGYTNISVYDGSWSEWGMN